MASTLFSPGGEAVRPEGTHMSSLKKREMPDRSKINLNKPGQAKCWTHELGISREQLCKLIEKVGNSAAAVRKELES
jgi:Protein of unknown function (DUF3606)